MSIIEGFDVNLYLFKNFNKMRVKLFIINLLLLSIFILSCSIDNVSNQKDNNGSDNIETNQNNSNENDDKNYVILLSLDGFRYDYIDKFNTKNIKNIAKKGVRVKRLNPSNPTKTFPNHYTIVTGLYPDNHGLIGNSFYDKKLGKYSMGDRNSVENGKFYGGEPIWNTAKKAGLKTASYFWVGSESKINGMQPDFWKPYKHNTPFKERINTVIDWLKLPKNKRPRLITLYYHQPDYEGHKTGTNSQELQNQIKYVDEQVAILYNKLMQLSIAKNINLIIVSDHGMKELDGTKNIYLEDYISIKDDIIGIYGGNPCYTIRAKKGKTDKVYNKLKNVKHLDVFKRGQAPKELHLANHHHTGDMMVIAKSPYGLYPVNKNFIPKKFGVHGYLNTTEEMGAIFVGVGNAFKVGYEQESINNVDIYNLIADILDIKPAQNNGNFENVKSLLKEK